MGDATPFELLGPSRTIRRAPKHLLLPLSVTLEIAAIQSRVPPMMLSCFQKRERFTPATAKRYSALAARLPFVCVLGEGMPAEPAPGVLGAELSPDDRLSEEWTVVVLGAHEAAALVARDCGDDGPDRERQFDYFVTHDRELVTSLAHAVIARLPRH